ncbi:YpiB family protein [Phosphitispora sp. TUW77]|uniref:YpiB family protein n=1 Tax=Phosphitispora sp. TUW77 TaxID=3152361 RepID=UPI003AB43CD2
MEEAVMLYKKKKFINAFLSKFELKKQEACQVLNFLLSRDRLLANTYFVENVRCLPNALIISASNASTVSFLCRINNEYYEDIEEIIYLLDYETPEELFVWLSFEKNFMYLTCINDLEIVPEIRDKIFHYQVIRVLEDEMTQKILDREKRKTEMLTEIDLALDNGDRKKFNYLVTRYKKLFITSQQAAGRNCQE